MTTPEPTAEELLRETAHRPYPMPDGAWIGRQSWKEVLLAHWRIGPEKLRALVPTSLEIDMQDGVGWVSAVLFQMANVRPRGLPRALSLSFPELNLRTYVRQAGRTGVFFFSLDATHLAATIIGRRLFGLPYFRARISTKRIRDQIHFDSVRAVGTAAFSATYSGGKPIPARDSVDTWLMERYCFYSLTAGSRILRCDVHHRPWPLQQAAASISRNELTGSLTAGAPAELLHYSPGVDVLFWPPRAV